MAKGNRLLLRRLLSAQTAENRIISGVTGKNYTRIQYRYNA